MMIAKTRISQPVLATLILAAAGAVAQGPPTTPMEVLDDPYLAIDPHERTTTPAAIVRRRALVSVQVNVDRDDRNITGDAANEPSIAVDPTSPNNITIGWRQFDSVLSNFRQAGWAFSTNGGRSWTFPGVLDRGVFRSDPVLDVDGGGRVYYNSLRAEGLTFWCEVYASETSGRSWSTPVSAYGGDKQWMSVDRTGGPGDGNIYSHWTSYWGCCGDNAFTRSTDEGGSFEYPVVMPGSPYWGTTTVGPDGTVYVAGLEDSSSIPIVGWSTTAQNQADPVAFDGYSFVDLGGATSAFIDPSPNPEGLLGQIWIATDHSSGPNSGNIYVLGSVDPPGTDPLDVHFIRSTDGGTTWSAPVRINGDPQDNGAWQWFGTMSVAPDGRIDVIWNDTRNDPGGYDSELFYASSSDGGVTWSAGVPVSPAFDPHLGWPNQNKIGDYYGMVSDLLGADLAWSATFNGEQDLFFLRIGDRDCNGNGVGDSSEPDSDLDEIIDACDNCPATSNPTQADSDHNGIGDACDTTIFSDGFEWGSDAAWNQVVP